MDVMNISLKIHLKGGKIYDFTDVLNKVTWSGDYMSPSRTLEVELLRAVNDKDFPDYDILIDSTCCFYVDGIEIFRGNAYNYSKNSSDNMVEITFKDIGMLLVKDKKYYNFNNVTIKEAVKKIFKDNKPSIKYKDIAEANIKISHVFVNKTGYEIIQSLYTMYSKQNGGKKKYMVVANLDSISIVEKGIKTLGIQFQEGFNIIDASYKEDLDSFVNRVLVVDEKGNKIAEKVNKDLLKLYNIYATEVIQTQKEDKTKQNIDSYFKGTEKSCSLQGIGDITCTTGSRVNVTDKYTGLVGIFYIDRDTHTWNAGHYTNSLELNFQNIMDEHDDFETEKGKSGSHLGVDWGHGVTVEQLNNVLKGKLAGKGHLFLKFGNAYKVNPMVLALMARVEAGANMDSRLARDNNNFFGIRDPDKKIKKDSNGFGIYNSVEEGIERGFRFISISHVHNRKRGFEQIISTWAPKSDGNNTTKYIADVKSLYKKYTGKEYDKKHLGTGVPNEKVAKDTLASYENYNESGSSEIGNAIVKEALKYEGRSNMQGYAWCCWFVQHVMKKVGYKPLINTNLSQAFLNAYKSNGSARGISYVPKPGDCIFFDNHWVRRVPNHIGIVVSVSGSPPNHKIHTIEGNNNNRVKRCTYGPRGAKGSDIVGYGIN